jgi:ABC-type phosphate/phosphonate transport system substrate-binding protein
MALWQAGIDPSDVRREYGKNHFTCLQSVVIGVADACGVAEPAFLTVEQTRTDTRLRILHKTVGMPRPLIVVHKRVSRKDRDALLKAIVEWPNTEEGKKILDRGQFVGFVAAKDAEYQVVRRYLRSRK